MDRFLGNLFFRIKNQIKSSLVTLRLVTYVTNLGKVDFEIDFLEISFNTYINRSSVNRSVITDNNYWGLDVLLNKYGLSKEKTYIEHGLYLDSYVKDDVFKFPNIDTIVTLCSYRVYMLRQGEWKGNILNVGSYIKHFKHDFPVVFEGKEVAAETSRALLFAPHSIKGLEKSVGREEFLSEIEKLSHAYREVWLALFWDYPGEYVNMSYPKNVKLVTAGSRYDNSFMYRLRSLIELCQVTFSFDVGTHAIYSLSLERDHIILDSKVSVSVSGHSGEKELDRIKRNIELNNIARSEIQNVCINETDVESKSKKLSKYFK